MKTILLTTDLSAESRIAFPVALEICQAFQAKLLLLAIIEDPAQAALIYAMDFPVLPHSEVIVQVREKVTRDLQELKETHFSALDSSCFVVEAKGPVHLEIVNFAKEHSADLIVMATHGRTGISKMLIGSVVDRVLKESACPVLTIPNPSQKSKGAIRI